jgi:hypothetical protein
MICFHHNLYNKYEARIPELCAVLIELAKERAVTEAAAGHIGEYAAKASQHFIKFCNMIVNKMDKTQKNGGKTKKRARKNRTRKNRARRYKVE